MSTDLTQRRKAELRRQFTHLQERIEQSDSLNHPRIASIIDGVESEFEEAELRHEEVQDAIEHGEGNRQLRRVYGSFAKQLDGIQQRLLDLQQTLVYLELRDQQQTVYGDRLGFTREVCYELDAVFSHDVEYLPVVWDGYAAHGIEYQEFYAVHIPRDESRVIGAPIISHELGHAVVDHLTNRDRAAFNNRLEEFVHEWKERKQSLVRLVWREWFVELVCDACGVLTFGPAYILATIEHLSHNNPYRLPSRNGYDAHPPDALRYEFICELGSEVLPTELYDRTEAARTAYDDHLDQTVRRVPAEYRDWLDDELFDGVKAAARSGIDPDIEQLCENILDEVSPSSEGSC